MTTSYPPPCSLMRCYTCSYHASHWICCTIKVPLSCAHITPPPSSKSYHFAMTSVVHCCIWSITMQDEHWCMSDIAYHTHSQKCRLQAHLAESSFLLIRFICFKWLQIRKSVWNNTYWFKRPWEIHGTILPGWLDMSVVNLIIQRRLHACECCTGSVTTRL